jgi:ComF family protein
VEDNLFFADGIKDLLFPPRCRGCDRQIQRQLPVQLCSACLALLSPISSPLCTCCGTPYLSGADHLCGICLNNGFFFDSARSLFLYEEPLQTVLTGFKFGGKLSGLDTLSALADQAGAMELFEVPDFILPVPLHRKRLRSRGFNQSLLLARACFPLWREKIQVDLLVRHRQTPPQSRLSGRARRNNLNKAFRLIKTTRVAGKSILLVDDVFTTGSTLRECSTVLKQAGADRVDAFTLARAL